MLLALTVVLAGQLHTGVKLSHSVGAGWPKLTVTLKNQGSTPIALMRFESDVCFASFLLSVTVDDETLEPVCPVRSFPGVAFELAPGATETRELDLKKLAPALKLARGHHDVFTQWSPDELKRMFDGGYAPKSENLTSSALHFVVAAPLGTVKAVRGKAVELPDGARFTLVRHGHKETMEGGPDSPLIIHARFAPKGKKETDEDSRVYFNEGRVFTVGDGYTFELGKYEYDGFMDLTYFGRVPPPKD